MQQLYHYSAVKTGFIMLSIAGFGVLVIPITRRWIDSYGSKPPLLFSRVSLIIGTLLMLTFKGGTGITWILVVLSFIGIGNGFNKLAIQTALLSLFSTKDSGMASGLLMTSRYIGSILSTSLLAIFFSEVITVGNFKKLITINSFISVIVLILVICLPKN